MIIDFHTHTFPDKICDRVMEQLSDKSKSDYFTNASVAALADSMKRAGVDYSINLPVMTNAAQTEKVNGSLIRQADALLSQGILTFGGIHPDNEDYRAQLKHLKENGIKGVKLHPAYQSCDIDDPRMLRIIDAASALDLIVLTHAGWDIGIMDKNYATVKGILHVIREVQPPKLVLAHMGNWNCWDEVERDLAGAPVWLDTAFSLGSIPPKKSCGEPPCRLYNLHEAEFVRLARKHGTDRILFATDCPWADQAQYVAWIRQCGLTDAECAQILGENGARLLFDRH